MQSNNINESHGVYADADLDEELATTPFRVEELDKNFEEDVGAIESKLSFKSWGAGLYNNFDPSKSRQQLKNTEAILHELQAQSKND